MQFSDQLSAPTVVPVISPFLNTLNPNICDHFIWFFFLSVDARSPAW